jgi:hypothetical protein
MDAMKIYESLEKPPVTAMRQIQDGALRGFTDINPQWRYRAMTEMFGLVGIGWKYRIAKLWSEPAANNEVLAFAQVEVFVRDKDTGEWSDPIVGVGGSKLVNNFSKGLKNSDEGYKMAITDAFSTSLKMLGVGAAVYEGRWDGSKYKEPPKSAAKSAAESAKGEPSKKDQTPTATADKKPDPARGAKGTGPAGGVDTPEEHEEIMRIMALKDPDGRPVFEKEEYRRLPIMRQRMTAQQVIESLTQEAGKRLDKRNAESMDGFEEDIPYSPTDSEEQELEDLF